MPRTPSFHASPVKESNDQKIEQIGTPDLAIIVEPMI